MSEDNLQEFIKKAANILDNISANFRLLRDRVPSDVFQPFCEQILQLARKVQALRYDDKAIPTPSLLDQLAQEAAEMVAQWLPHLGNGDLQKEPRERGAVANPQDALFAAVVRLGKIVDQARVAG